MKQGHFKIAFNQNKEKSLKPTGVIFLAKRWRVSSQPSVQLPPRLQLGFVADLRSQLPKGEGAHTEESEATVNGQTGYFVGLTL